jgi:hypothetical protein
MELPCLALRLWFLPAYSDVSDKTVSGLAVAQKKAVSFKRDLKVAGRDSYCAVRHQITPVRFRTPDLCPWMGLLVALPQPVNRDVGIDLRGGQAAVAKDFLDCAQVGSAIQQMRGR